jgi:hypothetical protein
VTRINSYPAGELFLTETHTSPVGVASGHLWYNPGTKFVGPISAALLGNLICQDVRDWLPTLELTPLVPRTSLLPPGCALPLNGVLAYVELLGFAIETTYLAN